MSTTVLAFLTIGAVSLVLMILSLFGGHSHVGHLHIGHMHLHLGHLHLGHPHLGHGGGPAQVSTNAGGGHPSQGESGGVHLTLPAIAGFLGAFGFGGAIAAALWPGSHETLVATAAGLIAAFPASWLAGRLMSAAMNISTDATLTSSDLLGTSGVVITPVPTDGLGEVRLSIAGQFMKVNSRAAEPLALGTKVFVIEVLSPTSVLVEPIPGAN
jgi:membrane protein implicated in regulation of membrane protease activity